MFGIDATTWTLVSPLLDAALDLPAEERQSWLDRLRAERPALATVVSELLAHHDRVLGSRFLEAPATTPAATLAGTTVGAYTLDALLGSGGMGVVWRARRSDGRFEGAVAVKLLHPSALDGTGADRFQREATMLARLSHANIARLFDAGVTPAGQPYLVLQLVEGRRIDEYADTAGLDVDRRLALFLQVCDAVAHAHAHLVVHRDIKPSNILVDAAGHATLLDFGIAQLLAGEGPPADAAATANRALTPEFASPEQIRGAAITTATDVYTLGVLLYRLLTGRHPTGSGLNSPLEHARAIVERTAEPASAVVPADRRRRLAGDLDVILATALKKDPGERYGSVEALANDLRRHLNHEPIAARPDTLAYRAATFVRRHRWPVVAAMAALSLLSAGLIVADRQRRIAESRFAQLRHLSEQVFALDARIRELPGATEAREALVAASLEYLQGLAADASSDVDLMTELVAGYLRVARIQGVPVGLSLGDFAKAEVSLQKADVLVEEVLAARPGDPRAVELSAAIRHDRMILADSERRDAAAFVHAAGAADRIELLLGNESASPSQREVVIRLYPNVALAYANLRRYEDAARLARRHLELVRSHDLGLLNANRSLSTLANALRLQGDLNEALKVIREARAAVGQAASTDTDTGQVFSRYALLLREGFILGEDRGVSLERPADAIVPLREAFEMQEAEARRDPNDYTSRTRVGTSGRELGDILRWREPREALAVYDVALGRLGEIANNVKARRDTAVVLAGSAYALRGLDRPAEAKRRIDEALAILATTKDYPAERISFDSEVYTVLLALADHHADEGQLTQAVEGYTGLLAKVMATKPEVETDLKEANNLSLLFQGLARLHRLTGAADAAAALDAARLALWQRWNHKLPGNDFVTRRLASDALPHRSRP